MFYYVYTNHVYKDYILLEYTMYIPCLYHAYTSQVVISQLYTRNIRGIYHMVHTMYTHTLLL
jgi:hypothetical protein